MPLTNMVDGRRDSATNSLTPWLQHQWENEKHQLSRRGSHDVLTRNTAISSRLYRKREHQRESLIGSDKKRYGKVIYMVVTYQTPDPDTTQTTGDDDNPQYNAMASFLAVQLDFLVQETCFELLVGPKAQYEIASPLCIADV